MIDPATETSLVSTILQQERRSSPRSAEMTQVLACPAGFEYKEEVQTVSSNSRNGLYFTTRSRHYRAGMLISIVEGYSPQTRYHTPSFGRVIRVDRLENGLGVAVQILMR